MGSRIWSRVVFFFLLFGAVDSKTLFAQSEFLTDRQSGVTVSFAHAESIKSFLPGRVRSFGVTGTIEDVVDVGFSYSTFERTSPAKTLSLAVHFNSNAARDLPRFAVVVQTNPALDNSFLGVELYVRSSVGRKVALVPAITVGVSTVTSEFSGFRTESTSQIGGSIGLGFGFSFASGLYLTVAPVYSFLGTSTDFIGVSTGLIFHGKKKVRRNANWDELSYAD